LSFSRRNIQIRIYKYGSEKSQNLRGPINIHASNEYYNFDLPFVKGLCLSIENFVVEPIDGASVMKKVERLTVSQHQICIIHDLHLAIIEVLLKTGTIETEDKW
jgi:hypothetical protein